MSINAELLEEELTEFCRSDSLSEDGLREIIERHGVALDSNDITNYDFFRQACNNEKVTEGTLRYLLEYFPNAIGYTGEVGRLPHHCICINKNVTLGMVQLLINAFPDSLRHEDNNGWMPLHALCLNSNLDEEIGLKILKLLIENCPESLRHATTEGGYLPLHFAAMKQSPEFCRILIEAYPGSELMTSGHGLPFHAACVLNTVATVKYLHQLYPESINVAATDGSPLIHYAIGSLGYRSNPKDGIKVMQFLLECNPDVIGATGSTPLHIASFIKNVTLGMVQLLVDAFPDSLRHEDNNGWMPLHTLCGNELLDHEIGLDVLKLLVEKCPEALRHSTTEGGYLPLHLAAMRQSPEFCRILIEAYPGSELMTNGHGLPFHAACVLNTVATVKYLYQLYPESINVANNNGVRPIHSTILGLKCREDNPEAAIEMVQFLLECNPDLVLQKFRGKLPLYWVCNRATNDNTQQRLDAYLKVLQILYDAHPDAIEDNDVTVDAGEFCAEVQTFINSQLTYARQARDRTLMHSQDENGQLPLHKALREKVCIGSIKFLVKGNPSAITCADNRGMIPSHVACQHHDSASVVEYLLDLDPTALHRKDFDDNTALHHACRSANHAIISLLTEKYGAVSVSKRNAHGQLPIDLLFASREVSDKEGVKYTESIFRLLRAYPATVMHCDLRQAGSEDCISQSKKKRKVGEL